MTINHLIFGALFLLAVDIISDWHFDHLQAEQEDRYEMAIDK